MNVTRKKKLIEVALPLDAINKASAREKSIRHGHPSTLHLWWARRPLAAARAVIFAQMVDDPSAHPDIFKTEEAQEEERQRLFRIIEDLVLWENTTNEKVLQQARDEIWKSWRYTCKENADHPMAAKLFDPEKLPGFHDPFAGGGSLPLEAQRLGLESYASDLNPVAVLINKAMIEIPPKFAGRPPVNPEARQDGQLFKKDWRGAQGLAEDVRYYGKWMRDEAEKRIGHLYPKVDITEEMAQERPDLKPLVGKKLTVIAWLWARTVKSPNPAFADVDVPLAATFMLSTKPGKEAYVEPVVESGGYRFTVKVGKPPAGAQEGTGAGKRAGFRCVVSGTPIDYPYIRTEGKAGRMGQKLMAIVVEGDGGRVYLSPIPEVEAVAVIANPTWKPAIETCGKARANLANYGMTTWSSLFTSRQLVTLTTLSDMVTEVRGKIRQDAIAAGMTNDVGVGGLDSSGNGATAYSEAVSVYLGCLVSAVADDLSSIVTWRPSHGTGATRGTFARQALPMIWDFAEANPFASAAGDLVSACSTIARVVAMFPAQGSGHADQADAVQVSAAAKWLVVSTDPPYYDNIGYADLSDFFYVWLRRSLKPLFPDLFATVVVPKTAELIASTYRHDNRQQAEAFFLSGMTQVMRNLSDQAHPSAPLTIYYAFKQSETETDSGTASTGWETFLEAVHQSGLAVTGTWPMRTERGARSVGIGSNALATSIVLVCRPRAADAPTATRRDFLTALKSELPVALTHLQHGNIAPVDLAQAAIGPGMAVYTRYAKVIDAAGKPLSVREALALINQTLDEVLAEQEGDFDADSRWALAWFDQSGFAEGEYGVAETLSKAKNTSVSGLVQAGILTSSRGKVRILKPDELPSHWDPTTDTRITAWEMVHHLVRALEAGGETAAAALARKLDGKVEVARELCYRLYTLCERKKRAVEALSYNGLVQSWPEIMRLAREGDGARAASRTEQTMMFGSEDD